MSNHDLLRCARMGDAQGVSDALEKGAWTETRRPLLMKPYKFASKPEDIAHAAAKQKEAVEEPGMTALMYVAQNGTTSAVRRLLAPGANVNALEEDGWTALHFAAKEQDLDISRCLLACRANQGLKTSDGKTPFDVAKVEDASFARKLQEVINDASREAEVARPPGAWV